jgi:hypothetical protein
MVKYSLGPKISVVLDFSDIVFDYSSYFKFLINFIYFVISYLSIKST